MAKHTVTLIPGDGIGTETTAAMQRVVAAAGADIEWEIAEAGAHLMEEFGTPLPPSTIDAVRKNKVAIKGPVTTPVGTGFRSVNVALRQALDLNVCLRPVLSIPGAGGRYEDVDLVIVRENSDDLYAGSEFEYAFNYAEKQGYKKVTAAHKANIMKHSDGLFLRCAREVAEEHPSIEFNDNIIDAFCMNIVMDPSQFEVIVFPNLYGDIASDLCAGLVGGLGIAPGANIGPEYAIFEAVHGSAPDIAGKDICNPTAEVLSAAMMLDHLGEFEIAQRIRDAVRAVYAEGKVLTADIRKATGSDATAATCTEFTDALVAQLER